VSSSRQGQKSLSKSNLNIKKELDVVYIDSSGTRYLDYKKALCAEAQIEMCKERKLQEKKITMDIVELVMRVLKSENWGIFYKNQPIQPLELQGGNALYKVNQVDDTHIEERLHEALTKGEAWQSSQTNLNQSKNSTTG
tara:strand:+ start:33 stop:449 length:417 start_codon:yes stop_codon:yes gene_type:complete